MHFNLVKRALKAPLRILTRARKSKKANKRSSVCSEQTLVGAGTYTPHSQFKIYPKAPFVVSAVTKQSRPNSSGTLTNNSTVSVSIPNAVPDTSSVGFIDSYLPSASNPTVLIDAALAAVSSNTFVKAVIESAPYSVFDAAIASAPACWLEEPHLASEGNIETAVAAPASPVMMLSEEAQASTRSSAIIDGAFNLSALDADALASDNGYTLVSDGVSLNASPSHASIDEDDGYTLVSEGDDPIASVSPLSLTDDSGYTLVSEENKVSIFFSSVFTDGDSGYTLVSGSNELWTFSSVSTDGNGGYTLTSGSDDPIASFSPVSLISDGGFTLVSGSDESNTTPSSVPIDGNGGYTLVSEGNYTNGPVPTVSIFGTHIRA